MQREGPAPRLETIAIAKTAAVDLFIAHHPQKTQPASETIRPRPAQR